ncbi:hypothetical protein MPC4_350017 [Methylocella tundrae]|uniref:Uncharacterized protein n=1 Tax=Methylocella tundrae TaxID=227605 RepID=A0A8B6M948_METTU|nr:hypothetical protein MPC1_7540001 [Methylocella tundrae]VTZ51311.1 hypothetical protein MPC4_350017 [Methylocella tundrae]
MPHAKVVRGFSDFGLSFVYVVFDDGTDLYWARSRVLEYLNFAAKRLPEGVTPALGPDASGVGWVYEYVVLGAQRTLAELRSIQDWIVRYNLVTAKASPRSRASAGSSVSIRLSSIRESSRLTASRLIASPAQFATATAMSAAARSR